MQNRMPTTGQRTELVNELEGRIAHLESGRIPASGPTESMQNHGCAVFGVTCARALAELFVEEFGRMKIAPPTFRGFINRARAHGYRSRVRGRLFHLLVRNFAPLQNDLLQNALGQLDELNNPQLHGSFPVGTKIPSLLNAKGVEVHGSMQFGPPLKAEEMRIRKKDGRAVEFVDDAYVSFADVPNARLWTFLCEIEIKTTGAASRFGKQIGFSQLRFGAQDMSAIEMTVAGFDGIVKIAPEHIVFSQRSIDRNAVTLLSTKKWLRLSDEDRATLAGAWQTGDVEEIYTRSDFRIQSTDLGHGDVFRKMTLAIHSGVLDLYVEALWPLVNR
jgi:hypothetical protein